MTFKNSTISHQTEPARAGAFVRSLLRRAASLMLMTALMAFGAATVASAQLPTHELPGLKPPAPREPVAPLMSGKSHYSEYWEQIFLMDDGTLFTSQFTIANFPFSKHRGLLLSTLVWPDGKTVVIKNGRSRKGWDYDAVAHELKIFQHTLAPTDEGYRLHLHNTAAEARMTFTPSAEPLVFLDREDGKKDYGVTYYAPAAEGNASWRPGPEIDGPGDNGPWMALGHGAGFGVHVIQTDSLGNMFKSWRRAFPLGKADGMRPVFNWMVTPEGEVEAQLGLLMPDGKVTSLKATDLALEKDGSRWKIRAKGQGISVRGSFSLTDQVDSFMLGDHLSAIEKLAAGALAKLKRNRFKATYDLTVQRDGKESHLEGKALAEVMTLDDAEEASAKKRRIRR